MSNQTTEVPAAPAAGTPPVEERQSTQVPHVGRPADTVENLTGADLRAEFARTRVSRRGPASVAQRNPRGPATHAPQPEASPETPPEETEEGDRSSNSASASAEGSTVEALAQGDEAQDQVQAPETPEIDMDDPDVIESLTDEQIKAIKDTSTRKLVRRVHRLTARLREAEAKLNQPDRGAKPEARQEQETSATGGDQYDAHPEVAPIAQKIASVEAAIEWAEANPDGGDYKDEDGKVLTLSPEQVANILRRGPRELAKLDAKRQIRIDSIREQEEGVRNASVQAAKAAYPWLANRDSEEYRTASEVVRNAPYLQKHPEWLLWVADAIEGRKARLARGNGAATPKPRTPPPKVPPPDGGAAPKVDKGAKELAEAEAEFERTGSANALKRVMSLKRAINRR